MGSGTMRAKPSDGSNTLRALERGRVEARGKPKSADFKAAVDRMSNWQRNAWARAGYPGLEKGDVDKVLDYAPAERVDARSTAITRLRRSA